MFERVCGKIDISNSRSIEVYKYVNWMEKDLIYRERT
jgi:hypothetical protein